MKKTLLLLALVVLMGISSIAFALGDLAGATSFLSGGSSYLPLQKVASFLGADLSWDIVNRQAVMTYQGKNLALTPNSLQAVLDGKTVSLPSPPVVVSGRTYIPASALKNTYGIPIEWDQARRQIKIKGPNGWDTVNVKSRPPWHGGPPPWAPAWGARKKQDAVRHSQPVKHQGASKSQGKSRSQSKGKK